VADILQRIVASKRHEVAARKSAYPLSQLKARAKAQAPPRGFAARLGARAAAREYGLIAELKKASPSGGLIRPDFDPKALARAYQAGGAACLSVLTDGPFFQGSDADLRAAREVVELPVLRKDFIVDLYQVAESRAIGADCVLLILAALTDAEAAELEAAALEYGMDVLIEVHDAAEMMRVYAMRSRLVGINNRDLKTLRVDLATAESLVPLAPPAALLVSESGLSQPADLERLARCGVRCFLVGESLLRQGDVTAATRRLLAHPFQQAVAG
jgi:indole-3-glycerol phosphate synthase